MDAACEGLWVPARVEAAAVLASLNQAGAFRHDPTSLDPVPEDDGEGTLALRGGFFAENACDIFAR